MLKILYLMQDHRFVSKLNKWFRVFESQRPQPCSKPSNKDQCLHSDKLPAFPANYMFRNQAASSLTKSNRKTIYDCFVLELVLWQNCQMHSNKQSYPRKSFFCHFACFFLCDVMSSKSRHTQ